MNIKRMRGRNHRGGGGGGNPTGPIRHHPSAGGGNIPLNRNHVFDSSGPEMRIRGTSQQLFEKYLQLGRDATSSGDRVLAESYFQHAEHYFRILNAMNQALQQSAPQGARRPPMGENGSDSEETTSEETQYAGLGDQPSESREIPIATTPSEG